MTWGEILTTREVEFCQGVEKDLANVAWVQPLLSKVRDAGFSYSSKPFLFELRFANDVHLRKLTAKYECQQTNIPGSVDFEIENHGTTWALELAAVMTSDAVKQATVEDGIFFETHLSSDAEDPRHSEEGELLLAQQKIGQKVFDGQSPVKFPEPVAGRYHAIIMDMRGFGLGGGDNLDYREIAFGPAGFSQADAHFRHYWRKPDGTLSPIRGLFDHGNRFLKAARFVQERIHFIGFSLDEDYSAGSILENVYYAANPYLFAPSEADEAFSKYPLRPSPNRFACL